MKSVLTYSRDSLASPLRVLDTMLERIRQGTFSPNSTRSGVMTANVKVEVSSGEEEVEPWEPVDRQQQDLDEEAGEDLGSGGDTSSGSESSCCDSCGPFGQRAQSTGWDRIEAASQVQDASSDPRGPQAIPSLRPKGRNVQWKPL